MGDPLRNLLRGFEGAYGRGVQSYNDEQRSQNILDREMALRSFVEQQKQQNEQSDLQNSQSNLRLLEGKSPEEQTKIMAGFPESDIKKYKSIQDATKLKELNQYEYSRPDGVYLKNTQTGELKKVADTNPYYIPKHVGNITGYDKQGHKTLEVVYDTGKRQIITTGLGKSGNVEDSDKFNKTLSNFNKNSEELDKMKSVYVQNKDSATEEARSFSQQRINNFAYNHEQALYAMMPKAARDEVNNFYNENKENAKKYKQDYSKVLENPATKEMFNNWVRAKFESGEIKDFNIARILSTWGQFKFGYMQSEQKTMSKDEFINDFKNEYKRKPTDIEIEKAKTARYWE